MEFISFIANAFIISLLAEGFIIASLKASLIASVIIYPFLFICKKYEYAKSKKWEKTFLKGFVGFWVIDLLINLVTSGRLFNSFSGLFALFIATLVLCFIGTVIGMKFYEKIKQNTKLPEELNYFASLFMTTFIWFIIYSLVIIIGFSVI